MKCCVLSVESQVQADLVSGLQQYWVLVERMEQINFGVNAFENKTAVVGCAAIPLFLVRIFSFPLCQMMDNKSSCSLSITSLTDF